MQLVPVAFAATVFGLLLAPYYTLPAVAGWMLGVLSFFAAILLRRNPAFAMLFLFLACALFANLRYPLQYQNIPAVTRADQTAATLEIAGDVVAVRQRSAGRSSVDLAVISAGSAGEVRAGRQPFMLRLFINGPAGQLLPGDRITFRGRLRKPRSFGTPGEFHWPRFLASQGVQATSWVKSVESLQVEPGVDFSIIRSLAAWKNRARLSIQASLQPERATLVQALVLGEGRSLPDGVRRVLSASGISHLFAISGLHLGLLGLFGYRLLLPLYRRCNRLLLWQPPQRLLPLVLLPALLTYLLLTGDAVATRRAFCLAVAVAVLLLWRRHVQPLRLLLSLALVFLLANPLLLWQPSWQLSFSGAAGILLWQPAWQGSVQHLPGYWRKPLGLLLVTVAATLATVPLVLLSFHQLAVAGPLANLLCVPLVTLLALPAGLLGLLLHSLWPQVAGTCFDVCGMVLEGCLSVAAWLIDLPGLSGQYLFLTNLQLFGLFVLFLPLLFCWQLSPTRKGVGLAGLTVLCGALLAWHSPVTTGTTLTMFSVGQGESLLLQSPQQAILVDGGGLYSDRFDVGERLLAPALGALGVDRLSAVVLTHDHPDHRKGLLFILEHFPVEQFWSGKPLEALDFNLRRLILDRGVQFRQIEPGWSTEPLWQAGELMTFRAGDGVKENDASLVVYLRDGNNGLLLTGDLERDGVGELIAAGLPGPVSLLKLPHHGSRYSGTGRLLDKLQPEYCLVSAGYQNRYRLPAMQVVDRLQEEGVPLLRTDLQGTVQAKSTVAGWLLSSWKYGRYR